MLVPSHYFKRALVDHASASSTNVPVSGPVLRRWFYLIPVLIAGEKAIAYRPITANAHPLIVASSFVGNVFLFHNLILQR
jgi:hypothetical protein